MKTFLKENKEVVKNCFVNGECFCQNLPLRKFRRGIRVCSLLLLLFLSNVKRLLQSLTLYLFQWYIKLRNDIGHFISKSFTCLKNL